MYCIFIKLKFTVYDGNTGTENHTFVYKCT